MAKVIWSDTAAGHLRAITAYLAGKDRDAAIRIGDQLYALGESLADFPNRGRPASGGRRELVSEPPYVLRYRVINDRALIISIRHGHQRPLDR